VSPEASEASENRAAKIAIATQLVKMMKKKKITQSELARRMATSRAVVHRLCKPDDDSVTLCTISKAVAALGCTMRFRLVPVG